MSRRCQHCGSTDIDVDATRADAVCTNCGSVLESSIIVSDIQFEENAHGGSSAIGTFVSSESKGGRTVGGTFVSSIGRESREITLKNARKKIVVLANQLRLRPDHIDMAFYFFKLALAKHLTRGRKSSHVIAACVYITCRTEGTSHMLIDFSDILQIDVYELGRTYLRLSQALCINIPAMDPCLYVMRFAHKLEFGDKTHDVSMTALRLVSRMKKDWIHFGRRPSGLCGAALLIAARLHEFCRTVTDVIKVVKVHESTLRKRLNEFGETPASQLTLDEFMTVDLDAMTEEQDPPSFKAARKKDRERLERLEEEEDLEKEMSQLEVEIERELEERRKKIRGPHSRHARSSSSSSGGSDLRSSSVDDVSASSPNSSDGEASREELDAAKFLEEETLGIISQCLDNSSSTTARREELDSLLMPPPGSTPVRSHSSPRNIVHSAISPGIGLKSTVEEYLTHSTQFTEEKKGDGEEDEELDTEGIDEDEIDSYIMNEQEIKQKTKLWLKINADYLLEQEEKMKREEIAREELIKAGKDPDKKRKFTKRKAKANLQGNSSAIEAIEKIVQEKKISTKINYDVLKSLMGGGGTPTKREDPDPTPTSQVETVKNSGISITNSSSSNMTSFINRKRQNLSDLDNRLGTAGGAPTKKLKPAQGGGGGGGGGKDSAPAAKNLSSPAVVDHPVPVKQLSAVVDPRPVKQLSAVVDPRPVKQLSAVVDPRPVKQLSAVVDPRPVKQLSAVAGAASVRAGSSRNELRLGSVLADAASAGASSASGDSAAGGANSASGGAVVVESGPVEPEVDEEEEDEDEEAEMSAAQLLNRHFGEDGGYGGEGEDYY